MKPTHLLRGTAASGLLAVRAEAKKPDSIEALATAFEAFKTTHTDQLNEIKAGKTDVVTNEKLTKIEAELDTLQAAIESVTRNTPPSFRPTSSAAS